MSAQCTDVRVNKVTEILFNDYKTPKEFLSMDINKLSEYIHSCGFYNSKSKNILETCKILVEKYDSCKVPKNMEDLTELPVSEEKQQMLLCLRHLEYLQSQWTLMYLELQTELNCKRSRCII